MSETSKFANVPADELEKYVADSEQRPGESDTDWAQRVRQAEADLLAKHKDHGPTGSGAGDPLSSIRAETAPDEREDQAE